MRTIIPFPLLQRLKSEPSRRHGSSVDSLQFPVSSGVEMPDEFDRPEGETMNAAVDELPRARALHDDIVGLIRAVRRRFL